MSQRTNHLRNGMFAAMTVAALGFGATQAFAKPSRVAAAMACNPYNDALCREWCQAQGANDGVCNESYVGGCWCIYW